MAPDNLTYKINSYSQDREDLFVQGHFNLRRDGRFLDVGAHNGRSNSNTLAFAELGWTGTLVEPSPRVFAELVKEYEPRLHDKMPFNLVCAAIGVEDTIMPFYDSGGDQVSTLSDQHREYWKHAGVNFGTFWVSTITWKNLLGALPGPYHFVSLDVEGITLASLITLLPYLKDLRTELLCVEKDEPGPMKLLFEMWDLTLVHETRENYIVDCTKIK